MKRFVQEAQNRADEMIREVEIERQKLQDELESFRGTFEGEVADLDNRRNALKAEIRELLNRLMQILDSDDSQAGNHKEAEQSS